MSVLPADRLASSNLSGRPSRTAMALSPDGRLVVFNGHPGKRVAIVCSWARSRRRDTGPGNRRWHRAVRFARRRVDRILGRQHDQEGACGRRAVRHDLRRAGRRELGRELGRRWHHLLRKPSGHLQGVFGRWNSRPRSPRPTPPSASVTCCRTRCPGGRALLFTRPSISSGSMGDGERRAAVARHRRAARSHPRWRRRALRQHGAPRVHEDRHVDGGALRHRDRSRSPARP